jgi:hypothetical protein
MVSALAVLTEQNTDRAAIPANIPYARFNIRVLTGSSWSALCRPSTHDRRGDTINDSWNTDFIFGERNADVFIACEYHAQVMPIAGSA